MSSESPIAVIGSGSWGTALAIQFARTRRDTVLWGRDRDALVRMAADRRNSRYLPDARFPPALRVEPDLEGALEKARDVLVAVPSHAFRAILEQLRPYFSVEDRLAWATKGFEDSSGKLPHEVVAEVLGKDVPSAVLSGPTFAKEVGAGLPTAMTVASENDLFAQELAESISDSSFRAYTSNDIVGVEVGGAVKNVLAIGAGISDGLGFGANTRVALVTRGLAEMARLGAALGAEKETFMGLAGIGDLILTCTDDQSRNRRMGLALAGGTPRKKAEEQIGQVVEGIHAAPVVHRKAGELDVEMPIAEQVYRVVYEDVPAKQAVHELMTRSLSAETD